MEKRYIFIGDIHGCADELKELLEKINIQKYDKIYSVGDIINKGPKSEETVQLLIRNNIKSVLGNHELFVFYVESHRSGQKTPFKLKKKHLELYDSLSESSIEYIKNLPLYIRIPEINTLVLHGGIMPYKKINEHSAYEMTSVRIVDPITKEFIKRDKDGLPWYYYYSGKERIIYGHTAAVSIKYRKNTVGIDTGCLYGEKLSAYILPDDKILSVEAKKVYEDYTQGGKYKMPL
jgi:diadenosine tetraphosphatase ApaH/serine/threonine PP2A family protein phosphatase